MKPSVQDATHYDILAGLWYKIGENTTYYWDNTKAGWKSYFLNPNGSTITRTVITAQKALERGYKYPQYPTTTEGVIVDSSGSGEVLEASPVQTGPIYDLRDINTTYRHQRSEPLTPSMTEVNDKKVNTTSANNRQVGGDHYKKMKIQPWDLFGSIFNLDEQIGFYLGNVYKYLMRYDSKNGIEDLMKAKHYLEKLIEVKRGAASADVGDK